MPLLSCSSKSLTPANPSPTQEITPVPDKPQSSAEEILASIGEAVDKIDMFHNQILVAVYIKPAYRVLASGDKLHLTDATVDEDKWQGKVGLVLKKGPQAFKSDARTDFGDMNVFPGEWVLFRVSDAPAIKINEVYCRLLEDIHIRGKVQSPEIIY